MLKIEFKIVFCVLYLNSKQKLFSAKVTVRKMFIFLVCACSICGLRGGLHAIAVAVAPADNFSTIVSIDDDSFGPVIKNPLQVAQFIANTLNPQLISKFHLDHLKNGLEVSDFMGCYFRDKFQYLLRANVSKQNSLTVLHLFRVPFLSTIVFTNVSDIAVFIEFELQKKKMHGGIYQGLLSSSKSSKQSRNYYPFLSFLLNVQSPNKTLRMLLVTIIIKKNQTKCYPHTIAEIGIGSNQNPENITFDRRKVGQIFVNKYNLISIIVHHRNGFADGYNISLNFDGNNLSRTAIEKYGDKWIRNKNRTCNKWGCRFSIFCLLFLTILCTVSNAMKHS